MSNLIVQNADIDAASPVGPNADTLYRLAEPQAGYFTAAQAKSAGFSRTLLAYYASTGLVSHVQHGIYRLRRFPDLERSEFHLALLRAGKNSAISHESALLLYDISDALPKQVHVTISRTTSQRKRHLRLHTGRLSKEDVTEYLGIRVTTIPRTLSDLVRAGYAHDQIRKAIRDAVSHGLVTRHTLRLFAEERGGRTAELIREALPVVEGE